MVKMEDSELENLLKLSNEELKEELKKLPPEERIEKLKELEEAREKEQEEREALKREALEEISLEDRFEETNIEEETRRPAFLEETELEQEVSNSPVEETQTVDYAQGVYRVTGLYNELRNIVEGEDRSNDSIYRASEIYNEILNNEHYQTQEEIKDIAFGSRKLMKNLMGDYVGELYKD